MNLTFTRPRSFRCVCVLLLALLSGEAGRLSAATVTGAGNEVAIGVTMADGFSYDIVLVTGEVVMVDPNDVSRVRVLFVDPDDDIVQVDFAGAGNLTVNLDGATGPAPAIKYNQATVSYYKGRATLTIQDYNETSFVTITTVGRANSVNQALFRSEVTYDGGADLAGMRFVAPGTSVFGALRAGNVRFSNSAGVVGIAAAGVTFNGVVQIGDISATNTATPVFTSGSASDVSVMGGDLFQPNGNTVTVSGFTRLKFVATTNSHGVALPEQSLLGQLQHTVTPGQPILVGPSTASFVAGSSVSFTVVAVGTPAPTYSVVSGTLPSWATLAANTGVISGTPPNAAGSPFSFTVGASNGVGVMATQVSGIARLAMTPGSTSHGTPQNAQANRGRLEQGGVDVTSQIVVNP